MGIRTAVQIVFLVACLASIAASRRGGRRRGGRGRSPRGEFAYWTRYLTPEVSVQESAFIAEHHNVVIFKSDDSALEALGYQTSVIFYGFEGYEPIMAISTRGRGSGKACFITTPQQSYLEMVDEMRSRNGTVVNTTTDVLSLNAVDSRLGHAAAHTFAQRHPMIRRVCRGNRFFDTRTTSPNNGTEDTRLIKALAADNQVEITFPIVPRRRQRPRGGSGSGRRRGRGGTGGWRGRGGRRVWRRRRVWRQRSASGRRERRGRHGRGSRRNRNNFRHRLGA